MTLVQTYVFVDIETTGLPQEELNKTRITELSMVAVKRQHVLDTRPGATPRVQHKLTLCLNPLRRVSDVATSTTGLCNDLLEYEPQFDKQTFTIIDNFLSVLSQPVCLIAHNGLGFDFPIIKNHLVKLQLDFTAEVLCADSYPAFYDIEQMKLKPSENVGSHLNGQAENSGNNEEDLSTNTAAVTSSPSSSDQTDADHIDYCTSNISMQSINETTPKTVSSTSNISMQAINETTPKTVPRVAQATRNVSKARKRLFFPWGNGPKPDLSYKLAKIYERVLNKKAHDAHRAENDCMFTLEISVAWNKDFVAWVDLHHDKFSDIEPMAIGVSMRKK